MKKLVILLQPALIDGLTHHRTATMVRAIFGGCRMPPAAEFLSAIMTEPGQRPTSDHLEDFERRLDKTLRERREVQKPDTAEG